MDSVHVVKDRKTGNSRGLAYVRFNRAYDAAIALETCDTSESLVYGVVALVTSYLSKLEMLQYNTVYTFLLCF